MMTLPLSRFPIRLPSVSNRLPTAALICAGALLLGVALASARAPDPGDRSTGQTETAATEGKSPGELAGHRDREGTQLVDQLGYFQMRGDRVSFVTDDGKKRFVGLENLSLERVVRTIADNPEPLPWSVTATITEYRGANFLLISRAVLKGRTQTRENGLPLPTLSGRGR